MDSGFEKDIDGIIDEMITKGKSDKEILDYIGGLTGLGPRTDAHEPTISVNEEEQSQFDDFEHDIDPSSQLGVDTFKAFSEREDQMHSEEDQILNEKWRQEERATRLAHRE